MIEFFVFINVLTIFLAMWIMYKNNQERVKLTRVEYETLEADEMTAITINYISMILVINIFAVFLYLVKLL